LNIIIALAVRNEAETLDSLLSQLTAYRVVLVDGASMDDTWEIVGDHPHVRGIRFQENRGIAAAYLKALGVAYALTEHDDDVIVQMDAGGTHDPNDIMRLVAQTAYADLAIGSRFLPGQYERQGYRTAISLAAAWLMRQRGINVHDATSGFRAWKAGLAGALDFDAVKAHNFAFQLELLHQAHRLDACIIEVPIAYRLTNSSFRWGMVAEAVRVYTAMWL
jgi:glycosyltransferase involved in cell wall biosynthesis